MLRCHDYEEQVCTYVLQVVFNSGPQLGPEFPLLNEGIVKRHTSTSLRDCIPSIPAAVINREWQSLSEGGPK